MIALYYSNDNRVYGKILALANLYYKPFCKRFVIEILLHHAHYVTESTPPYY